eukprot:TRINITY_DN1245_c0_g1_i1.p1 TRINITY_DN1245_c0_g1~~TRINITY_DN1245_c0_g1_i1.p1  ORF type:complete len:359 (+),score=73.27 TRINITY_DN1245_c0_g1_i1:313-1389(+)
MVLECAGTVPSEADPRPTFENKQDTEPQLPKSKDSSKKKKVNRRAKLKQSKLDVRREQWLSQGKNKMNGNGLQQQQQMQNANDNNSYQKTDNCKENVTENGTREDNGHSQVEQGDSNSSGSFSDRESRKGSVEEDDQSSSEDTNSKSQAPDSSAEEEQGQDHESDVEDDWEAAADALNVGDPDPPVKNSSQGTTSMATPPSTNQPKPFSIEEGMLKPEYKIRSPSLGNRSSSRSSNCRAWRPDDTCRPNSLPKLSKINSFPSQSCRSSRGGWSNSTAGSVANNPAPLSCPICYEDLDITDSYFSPCSCGFRLCLFCHKRIMEQDARCPGCRKRYNVNDTASKVATVRLPRSFSMSLRV